MTTDEDGEREVSEPSEPSKALAMPRAKVTKVKAKGQQLNEPTSPNRPKLWYQPRQGHAM